MSGLLVLVPTEFELSKLQPLLADRVERAGAIMMTCGFGPISSGIQTMQLLMQHRPESVVLIGIAGALSNHLDIGTATDFSQCACYGVGAGSGPDFRTSEELGWPQWVDPKSQRCVGDILSLSDESDSDGAGRMVLTACAASDSTDDVKNRLRRFPEAAAEDMEAFSVAMACRMVDVPLTVIRGISNVAGDRNKANWKVTAALNAAAELFLARFSQ